MFGSLFVFEPVPRIPDDPPTRRSTILLLERVLAGTFSAQPFHRLNVIHVVVT